MVMNLQVHETVENLLPSWVPSGQGYNVRCVPPYLFLY